MSPADAEKKLWGALPKSPLAFELRFRGVRNLRTIEIVLRVDCSWLKEEHVLPPLKTDFDWPKTMIAPETGDTMRRFKHAVASNS